MMCDSRHINNSDKKQIINAKYLLYLVVLFGVQPMASLFRAYLPGNLRYLGRNCAGSTSVENSLLGALIALVIILAVSELGSMVYQIFDLTAQIVEQTVNSTTGKCGPGNGNGNCGNSGNGGGNTGGSGPGTGNGGGNNGQGNGSGNGGGGHGNGSGDDDDDDDDDDSNGNRGRGNRNDD